MRVLSNLIFVMATFLTVQAHAQGMPDNIKKQIQARWIGDWEEVASHDGKKINSTFSWKWSKSKANVILNC